MSYRHSLGALPAISSVHATQVAQPATLQQTGGGSTVTRVLLVGAVAGAAFLLWRKFRKKG